MANVARISFEQRNGREEQRTRTAKWHRRLVTKQPTDLVPLISYTGSRPPKSDRSHPIAPGDVKSFARKLQRYDLQQFNRGYKNKQHKKQKIQRKIIRQLNGQDRKHHREQR